MKKISNNQIALALYDLLKNKQGPDLTDASKKVASFLSRKKLSSRNSKILKELRKIELRQSGIIEAEVKTNVSLSNETKKNLEKYLKDKYNVNQILIKETLDSKILGGFVLRIEDEIVDLSMAGRLKKLNNYLLSKI